MKQTFFLAALFAVAAALSLRAKAPDTSATNTIALIWDSEMKEISAHPGDESGECFFICTNVSSTNVVIDFVSTSCGCTTLELPDTPWTLAPGKDGKITATVDFEAMEGVFARQVYVQYGTNSVILEIKVNAPITATNTPTTTEAERLLNRQIATTDRQAIFKNDCARCHATPAQMKTGRELYAAACGICHTPRRAPFVTDLHALGHPVNAAYWKH